MSLSYLKKVNIASMHIDGILMMVSISLLMIGYVMVTSASLHLGTKMVGDSLYYPVRQFKHILLGLVAAGIIASIKLENWEKSGAWMFIVGLALLVMVLVPGLGARVNGSVRWLMLGSIRVQVSEVVKLISVVYMASYVTRHQEFIRSSAYGLLKPLILLSFACFLLLLEPDFGSAVVLLVIALGVMFISGARLWQFGILLLLVSVLALMLVYFSPYRWARMTSFTNPWADPLASGFQLVQALISFGRGEWLGVGLGGGIQKLFYLPEAHTDFLFSVIAEELGFIGVLLVIGLFSLLIWRAITIGFNAEKAGLKFAAYIAYGLGIWFGFQSIVNMGVNMGVLPTKGLTLPLMSYGGGSMIVMCSAMALLFRVHYETREYLLNLPKGKPEWVNA